MKILLRHRVTRAFFKEGLWVYDARDAQELPSISEARKLYELHQLKVAEIYLMAQDQPDPKLDMVIQLQPPDAPASKPP